MLHEIMELCYFTIATHTHTCIVRIDMFIFLYRQLTVTGHQTLFLVEWIILMALINKLHRTMWIFIYE